MNFYVKVKSQEIHGYSEKLHITMYLQYFFFAFLIYLPGMSELNTVNCVISET